VDSGREQIVFVALGDGVFEPRRVTVGRRLESKVQILSGLAAGQRVASGATFLFDSESRLDATIERLLPQPPASGARGAQP